MVKPGTHTGQLGAGMEVIKALADGSLKPDKKYSGDGRVVFETILGRVTVTLPPSTVNALREEASGKY